MNYFLAKTEPSTYSIDNLQKDKVTIWDGVNNAQAVQNLKSMKLKDRVLIYHSGSDKNIQGLAQVSKIIGIDPKNPKSYLVEIKFLKKFSEPLISLQQIKQEKQFSDIALVKQSRLSVMPLPEKFIAWLDKKGLKLL